MSNFLLGLIGAVAGLVVALISNLIMLPFVLKRQEASIRDDWKMPILGWDKARMRAQTRFMYRIPIPVLFAFVGAVTAVSEFGSSQ